MTIERFILIVSVIISISTILYIPKNQFRRTFLSMLSFQATTWFVSLILVQTGLLIFPVREFTKATRVAFTTEFFFYPAIFVWFMLLLPGRIGLIKKMLHWVIFISISSWSAYFFGKYTDLSEFIKESNPSNIFNTYLLFTLQYLLCFTYIKWFFEKKPEGGI